MRPGLAVVLAAAVAFGCGGAPEEGRGVKVIRVAPGFGADQAGLRAGDRIVGWSAGSRRGRVESGFDVEAVEIVEAPVATVALRAIRDGAVFEAALPAEEWRIDVTPGEPARPEDAAWLERRRGEELVRARKPEQARAAFDAARAAAAADPDALVALWQAEGAAFGATGARERADAAFKEARALAARHAPGTLREAAVLAAEGEYRKRGPVELAAAEALYQDALARRAKLAPGSLATAQALYALASIAYRRGDLDTAEARGLEASRLLAALPGQPYAFEAVDDLRGLIALERGDLGAAEPLFRAALRRCERQAAGSREEALALSHLGVLHRWRGEYELAQPLYERALAIFERLAPDSGETAGALHNLARVAIDRGEPAAAARLFERSLAIRQRLSPDGVEVAESLSNLAGLAMKRGAADEARGLELRALAIKRRLAPGSNVLANSLAQLGEIERTRGDSAAARRALGEALEVRRALGPGTAQEAAILQSLGRVERDAGHLERASDLFARAVAALEDQRGKLGAGDLPEFAARTAEIYRDAIETLVDRRAPEAAFAMLERSRARSLLTAMSQRELRLGDGPPEIDARRRRVERACDEALAELARLSRGRDDARIAELQGRLGLLREERHAVYAELRAAAPRQAAVRDPLPLDLAGARAALAPGTRLLAWSVGETVTLLFVLSDAAATPGLAVLRLPVGRRELADRVAAFRGLIEETRGGTAPAAVAAQGERLYALLLAPAEAALRGADRLVLAPDGPLRALPFAALRRRGSWLAEAQPLSQVVSATLLAELRRLPRSQRAPGPELVAFGDPDYGPPGARGDGGAALSSLGLPALPYTRREVEALAALFGSSAEIHVGREASEAAARRVGRQPRYVHFATHARLDRRFPLDSALAFSAPAADAADNGLLQAWEVFEKLRLDADLVTLSACETGLGADAAGEGLVGLVRAFHYAGARAVLASQWAVVEGATAHLMTAFYRGLRAGRPADEALRDAQVEAIRAGQPPHAWAAFTLSGEPR